jgi:hypothetical protein
MSAEYFELVGRALQFSGAALRLDAIGGTFI